MRMVGKIRKNLMKMYRPSPPPVDFFFMGRRPSPSAGGASISVVIGT
jgi:hypothetical protein